MPPVFPLILHQNQTKKGKYEKLITEKLGFGGYAAWAGDYFLAALGGLFIIQAVFNLSCCGSGGCSVASQKKTLYQDVIKPYHPDASHK